MSKLNSGLLSNIKDYIPFLYIIFVCLGYLDKSSYFNKFGIDILNYLNTSELVFMFIPTGSFVLNLIILMVLIFGSFFIAGNEESNLETKKETKMKEKTSENKNEEKDLHNPSNFSDKKIDRLIQKVRVIGEAAIFLYAVSVIPLLTIYFTIAKRFGFSPINLWAVGILFGIWGIIMTNKFLSMKPELNKNLDMNIFFIILMLSIVFFFKLNSNDTVANRINDGEASHYIEFRLDDITIKTNETILYLGQTNDYLFLRNIKSKTNHIYQKNLVEELIIRKLSPTN